MVVTISIPACSGCCGTCHDLWGDTLDVVVSGISECNGCYTVPIGGGSFKDFEVDWTGINGSHTLTWDGSQWTATIETGNITIRQYASFDGTCTGLEDTFTGDTDMAVVCTGDNILQPVFINGHAGAFIASIFSNQSGTVTIDEAIPNELNCGDIGGDGIFAGGTGGTVTVTVP